MYYSFFIIEFVGYVLYEIVLLFFVGVVVMNVIGIVVGIFFIDWCGRRWLVIFSLVGVILVFCLFLVVFYFISFSLFNISWVVYFDKVDIICFVFFYFGNVLMFEFLLICIGCL